MRKRSIVAVAGTSVALAVAFLVVVRAVGSPSAIDLGTLGGNYAIANRVNSLGHVVGASQTADGQSRAFFWRERQGTGRSMGTPWDPTPVGEMIDLGTLPGFPFSSAVAVNDRDQVVVDVARFPLHRACLWEHGQMTDLGTLPGDVGARPCDINVRGQVVGYSMVTADLGPFRAVAWRRGHADLLPGLPGLPESTWHVATAINAAGDIVGSSGGRPVIWQGGLPTDLGVLPGYDSGSAEDINVRGQVVGSVSSNADQRCVLWQDGVITDLGMLPGHDQCWATSINDVGQVVGYLTNSVTGDVTPFIWEDRVMSDLNLYAAAPPGSGWTLHFPMGNEDGAIVGRGSNANGLYRAFKLQNLVR
jgi:probable HAF family extracellular repeat protein